MEGLYIFKQALNNDLQGWIARQMREDLNFVRPVHKSGNPMNMHMAFYGRVWDPGDYTYYDEHEVLEAAPLPDWLKALANIHVKRAGFDHVDFDTALVNWYGQESTLGIHQDKDEEQALLDAGSPVVSFSIGSAATFAYGDTRKEAQTQNVELTSGDIVVFGGPARLMYHGITGITPDSCPSYLDFKNPGRINITLRQTRTNDEASTLVEEEPAV